jgi:hypothetical protein
VPLWELHGEIPCLAAAERSANVASVARVIGSASVGDIFGRVATDWMNSAYFTSSPSCRECCVYPRVQG